MLALIAGARSDATQSVNSLIADRGGWKRGVGSGGLEAGGRGRPDGSFDRRRRYYDLDSEMRIKGRIEIPLEIQVEMKVETRRS